MYSLPGLQPKAGCVPRPLGNGGLASGIPTHVPAPPFPAHLGSLHRHNPMSDGAPLHRASVQKVCLNEYSYAIE